MAMRCWLLGLAKALLISSAWAALIPATSMMSCTTCSCHTMMPQPRARARSSKGWSYSQEAPVAVAFHEPGHGAALDAHAGTDEGHLIG